MPPIRVRRWQPLENGDLLVELNARQEDGPQLSVKKLLIALGVADDLIARVPVTREMLVLEARTKGRAPGTKPSNAVAT